MRTTQKRSRYPSEAGGRGRSTEDRRMFGRSISQAVPSGVIRTLNIRASSMLPSLRLPSIPSYLVGFFSGRQGFGIPNAFAICSNPHSFLYCSSSSSRPRNLTKPHFDLGS